MSILEDIRKISNCDIPLKTLEKKEFIRFVKNIKGKIYGNLYFLCQGYEKNENGEFYLNSRINIRGINYKNSEYDYDFIIEEGEWTLFHGFFFTERVMETLIIEEKTEKEEDLIKTFITLQGRGSNYNCVFENRKRITKEGIIEENNLIYQKHEDGSVSFFGNFIERDNFERMETLRGTFYSFLYIEGPVKNLFSRCISFDKFPNKDEGDSLRLVYDKDAEIINLLKTNQLKEILSIQDFSELKVYLKEQKFLQKNIEKKFDVFVINIYYM